MDEVTVVIAARNEPDILTLAQNVNRLGYGLVVVDDASNEPIQLPRGIVLRNETRQGIGRSLMRGWQAALDNGAQVILQMDAGGSHDPWQLRRLIDGLNQGYDVVIGSRFCKDARYIGNPRRQFLSLLATHACNFAQPKWKHTDWTSGFRSFRAPVVKYLLRRPYYANMHGWQIETLWYAHRNWTAVTEVPIAYVAGRSSFNWGAASEAFGIWLQLFFS